MSSLPRRDLIELSLRRLSRLTTLQREYGGQLNEAGLRLLRATTFSAYCDCRALGVGDRALALIQSAAPPAALPAPREEALAEVAG
jgi:hypothetical protein